MPIDALSESDSAAESRRKKRRRVILAVIVAVAAGVYLLRKTPDTHEGPDARTASSAEHAAPGAPRAVPVVAVKATVRDIAVVLDGLGTVTPLATVTVRPRVDGQLMAVSFREGQVVKAGDPLAEIDPRPFEVQRNQAQGQMARDQALLANAKVDLERYRVLFKQDSVAKQQLDSQESLVHQYEAALQLDQAQVDNASLQIVYCHITAPISGRLGLRLVDAGNMVHASDPGGIVTITQMQPIAVVFTIAEDHLPPLRAKLNAGERLQVEAWDREQRQRLAVGTLTTVDNQIDPNTGTVRVKAEFPNTDEELFPNQFVNARVFQDVRRGSVVVPAAAVQRGARGTYVCVVKADQTVEVRPVTVGPSEKEDTAIESGLSAGETVVTDGAEGLRDGSKVEAQIAGQASAQTGP